MRAQHGRIVWALIFVLVFVVASACSSSEQALPDSSSQGRFELFGDDSDPKLGADLRDALDAARRDQHFPGLSAAVMIGESTIWTGNTGYAVVATQRPIARRTNFALASMSKAYVSVLAAQLIDEGVLALDAPLSRWVPEFPNSTHISVQQLLTRTSGITDDNDHPFAAVDADPDRRWTTAENLRRIPPPVCPPGTCDSGFENAPIDLLALAIMRATHSTLSILYTERFMRPIGMDDLYLQAERPVLGDIAQGYVVDADGRFTRTQGPPGPLTTSWATSLAPAGGAASTAQDVAIWTKAVLAGDVLDGGARDIVRNVERFKDVVGSHECTPTGVAFGVGTIEGHRARIANGSIPGFSSALAYLPDVDLTVVALGNASPGRHDPTAIHAVRDALIHEALGHMPTARPAKSSCNVDIYAARSDGTDVRRLTSDPGVDAAEPSWSPDGRRLLFGSNRDGNFEVYAMNADGSDERNLTNDSASDDGAGWSPDGKHLVLTSDRDGDHELYTTDDDGSNLEQLTYNDVEDTAGAWSPDGSTIAFVRGPGGNADLYTIRADGSGERRLTSTGDVHHWIPSWSPDGKHIVFAVVPSRSLVPQHIDVVNARGSQRRTIVSDAAGATQPSWGPTGRIAYSSDGDLFTVDARGKDRTRVTDTWASEVAPAWSPNGERLAFASERREPVER